MSLGLCSTPNTEAIAVILLRMPMAERSRSRRWLRSTGSKTLCSLRSCPTACPRASKYACSSLRSCPTARPSDSIASCWLRNSFLRCRWICLSLTIAATPAAAMTTIKTLSSKLVRRIQSLGGRTGLHHPGLFGELPVGVDHLLDRADRQYPSVIQQQPARAPLLDELHRVRGQHQDARMAHEFLDAALRLGEKAGIAGGQPLVHDQDVGGDAGRNSEGQANHHSGGVGPHRHVEVVAKFGEFGNRRRPSHHIARVDTHI